MWTTLPSSPPDTTLFRHAHSHNPVVCCDAVSDCTPSMPMRSRLALASLLLAGPALAQPTSTAPDNIHRPLQTALVEHRHVGAEQLVPVQAQVLGFFDERPAQDEIITLPTAAGPVRVSFGYLLAQPSRKFLATGKYRFHFGFWMPGGRMPGVDTSDFTLMPKESYGWNPRHSEYFVSLGPMVVPGAVRPNDFDIGPLPEQGLRNLLSTFGRDNFSYEVGPRMTRAVPKPGTSAFDLYYSTPDGMGGPLPFSVGCPTQGRARAEEICTGNVMFPSAGLLSAVRIRIEAVHLLPEALDEAARLLASWMTSK